MLKKKENKNKEYCIVLVCDDEVTTEVIDAFKFKNVRYKRIETGKPSGTLMTIYITKD